MNHPNRPTFLVIGAAKSATTSLCGLLGHHPDVYVSNPKEPNFFSYDPNYAKGWEGEYGRFFAGVKNEKAIGEGSTSYSMTGVYPNTIARIASDLPAARFIYLVRHPLRRLESLWIQWRGSGERPIPADFAEALRTVPHFIDSSLYFRQISAYRKYFSDDRLLLLFFEEFKSDPAAVLDKCWRFLGVDPIEPPDDASRPTNQWESKMLDGALLAAMRRLRPFNAVRDTLPGPVRSVLRRCFKRPVTNRPAWDAATHRWVVQQIESDSRALLDYAGKPMDYWDLRLA